MNTSLHTNPYFNPEPTTILLCLKMVTIITTLFSGICLYTIAFKSPKFMSKVFVRLTLYHFSVLTLTSIILSFMAYPIFYLPYISVRWIGGFETLGIHPIARTSIVVTCLLISASMAAPLFYYRMDTLLMQGHILKTKYLRYFIYTMTYVIIPIAPTPLFYFNLSENQRELKKLLFLRYQIYYEDFMSDDIVVSRLDGPNISPQLTVYFTFFCCVAGAIVIVVSASIIWKLTSKVGRIGSALYKAQQRQVLVSLGTMTAGCLVVMLILVPGLIAIVTTNSLRSDLGHVVACLGSAMNPFALGYAPPRSGGAISF